MLTLTVTAIYHRSVAVRERKCSVKRFICLALALIPVVAAHAQSGAVTGTWAVVANVSGNQSELSCTFAQKEGELTGSCKGDRGSYAITGKVEGKTVSWQYDTEYEGQKLTPVYTGTLESAEKIVGTVDVRGMGLGGEFTATKAK
jgi:hypothetical protein